MERGGGQEGQRGKALGGRERKKGSRKGEWEEGGPGKGRRTRWEGGRRTGEGHGGPSAGGIRWRCPPTLPRPDSLPMKVWAHQRNRLGPLARGQGPLEGAPISRSPTHLGQGDFLAVGWPTWSPVEGRTLRAKWGNPGESEAARHAVGTRGDGGGQWPRTRPALLPGHPENTDGV